MSAVAEQSARDAVSDYQGNAGDAALEDLSPDYDSLEDIVVEPAATPAERNVATLVAMLRRLCLALVQHLADEGAQDDAAVGGL